MALTDTAIKQAAPAPGKRYRKLHDSGGLFLFLTDAGAKYWRLAYRVDGKQKTLSLGPYPRVGLKDARRLATEARAKLDCGIDPSAARKAEKLSRQTASANTFEVILREWFEKEKGKWAPSHIKKQTSLVETHLIPLLGAYPIANITPPVLLQALRKIEARGTLETCSRVKAISGSVFRYGIVTGRCERDPSADLKGALKSPKTTHFAAITDPNDFGALLRAIDGLSGSLIVTTAMKLAPMLFVRPGELRKAEWSEIDLDEAVWAIGAHKMKMHQPHIVPLSRQAIELLKELEPLTGHGQYVFPGERSRKIPMSDNTLNACLRRMGYSKEQMVAHGFRASARTLMDEVLGVAPHLIEQQLAHTVRDPLGRAYNRTKHLPQRKKMMQRWSDYLDELKVSNIVPRRRAK